MRVSELAKELGVESKTVIDILASNGIEKKAQSGLDEDGISLVKNKLTGNQKAEKPAEKKEVKAEDKTNDKKSASEKQAEAAPAKAAKKPADADNQAKKPADSEGQPRKKKPNFSSVSNRFSTAGSAASSQQRRRRPDGARPQQKDERNNHGGDSLHRPIKPRGIDHISDETHARSERIDNEAKRELNERRERKEAVENKERIARQENASAENNQNENASTERPYRNVYRDAAAKNSENKGDRSQGRPSDKNNHGDSANRHDRNGRPDNNKDKNARHDRNERGNRNSTSVVSNQPSEVADGRKGSHKGNDKKKGKGNYDNLGGKKQENFINLEKNGGKKKNKPQVKKEEEEIKSIKVPEKINIRDLADRMRIQPSQIIKQLFMKGQILTLNSEVTYEQAEEIAVEYDILCEPEEKVDVIAELLKEEEEDETKMVSRPPVVCVMGHVDHGKTSLLDAIRDTKVTDREAGGITQAIGAYVVTINGQKITFLDTPGHEAFTAMRMRGANSTDIAILVVAADDGVMPQTVEAINHAKAAGVEIIVAINKIDKPNANIERVKQELSEYELIPEDWGGSTVFVPVSAKTHEGIDNLLEMVLLTAEVLELKANPKRNARGLVIEAQLDKGRGAVATVLVQKGTLHVGDPVAAGSSYGKVRAMIDDNGRRVKSAGPSTPVEILGLSEAPNAGEIFVAMDNEKDARSFAETFISENKNRLVEDTKMQMSLDDLYSQIQSGNLKELKIIVKADVQGSVEALKQSLIKLSNEEVVVKIIHGGVGAITESDVTLAAASNAIIIGFNVRPDNQAKQTAESEKVDVRLYSVIYNAIEDVEAAMKGMLDPIFEEKVIGHAEVRQIFKASGVGNIAGSYVLDGYFERGCKVRVSRGGDQIFEGDLASLKRFKDDVKEVKAGFECGLVIDGFNEIEIEDVIESYIMVEVPR